MTEGEERLSEFMSRNPGSMMLILDAIFKDEFGPGERISEPFFGTWNPFIEFLECVEKNGGDVEKANKELEEICKGKL